jgi:hypothetical protein
MLEVDRLNEAILNELWEEIRRRGARLLVVVIPYWNFARRTDRSERFLEDWGRRSGVPVLMLRQAFLALPPETRAALYADHWTPLGHRVAAEAIRRRIVELGLLER